MAKYDITNAVPFNEQPLYKQGYADAIEKAEEWFRYNAWSFGNYAQGDSSYEWEMAYECFRNAMMEE